MTSPEVAHELAVSSRTKVENLPNESILNPHDEWRAPADGLRALSERSSTNDSMQSLESALRAEKQAPASDTRSAEVETTLARVQRLQQLSQSDLSSWLENAAQQARVFEQLSALSAAVSRQAVNGFAPVLLDEQRKVVTLTDKVNMTMLTDEAKDIELAISRAQSPAVRSHLQRQLEDKRWQLAAPFVERARLTGFLLDAQRPYQAERVLEAALAQDIPPEALKSPILMALRHDAQLRLAELKVENRLVTNYDKYLPALDLDKDGQVSADELQSAKTATGDEKLRQLAEYLDKKHSHVTGRGTRYGITRDAVLDFARARAAKLKEIPED